MATRKDKQSPQPIRIRHEFPPPRPDDGERFLKLVRMLVTMGRKVKEE
jgi:hypothetical protein